MPDPIDATILVALKLLELAPLLAKEVKNDPEISNKLKESDSAEDTLKLLMQIGKKRAK